MSGNSSAQKEGEAAQNESNAIQRERNTFISCLSPRGGAILAAVIADILADGLDSGQIAALAGFITIIGDSLGFISAQMDLLEDPETSDTFTR
jgi:hypothetical protein